MFLVSDTRAYKYGEAKTNFKLEDGSGLIIPRVLDDTHFVSGLKAKKERRWKRSPPRHKITITAYNHRAMQIYASEAILHAGTSTLSLQKGIKSLRTQAQVHCSLCSHECHIASKHKQLMISLHSTV